MLTCARKLANKLGHSEETFIRDIDEDSTLIFLFDDDSKKLKKEIFKEMDRTYFFQSTYYKETLEAIVPDVAKFKKQLKEKARMYELKLILKPNKTQTFDGKPDSPKFIAELWNSKYNELTVFLKFFKDKNLNFDTVSSDGKCTDWIGIKDIESFKELVLEINNPHSSYFSC